MQSLAGRQHECDVATVCQESRVGATGTVGAVLRQHAGGAAGSAGEAGACGERRDCRRSASGVRTLQTWVERVV